jgi:hypothetical protein
MRRSRGLHERGPYSRERPPGPASTPTPRSTGARPCTATFTSDTPDPRPPRAGLGAHGGAPSRRPSTLLDSSHLGTSRAASWALDSPHPHSSGSCLPPPALLAALAPGSVAGGGSATMGEPGSRGAAAGGRWAPRCAVVGELSPSMLAMLALVELPAGPMRLRTSSGVVSSGRCHTVAVGGEGAKGAPVRTESSRASTTPTRSWPTHAP